MQRETLAAVQARIGYTFVSPALLECALTHKSYANECGGESNGRLEYLGDSVLGLVEAERLYRTCGEDEGVLTARRQNVVSKEPLCAAVHKMGILPYYRLGKGAKMGLNGFGDKPISDLFEAILGAVYLDGGLNAARAFVERNLSQP